MEVLPLCLILFVFFDVTVDFAFEALDDLLAALFLLNDGLLFGFSIQAWVDAVGYGRDTVENRFALFTFFDAASVFLVTLLRVAVHRDLGRR